jgi:hypothetical protein
MKIVQSLWSKPGKKKDFKDFSVTNTCGWPSKKHNYLSWTLSCLQFKKYYDEVELVTDEAGYDLLIDKLHLPYSTVKVVLDVLNDYHEGLFALGKIHAYSLQDKPFIHADGDVYIWKRFDKYLEDASLVCQNIERGVDYNRWYMKAFWELVQEFETYPFVLDQCIAKNDCITAANTGIVGGSNLRFFKDFAREARDFVDRNTKHVDKININMFNAIFEQFLFYALAESCGEKLTYYNPGFVRFWNDIADFTCIPSKSKYIHAMGIFKRTRSTVDALEDYVRDHYPDFYFNLMNLLRTNQI